MYHPLFAVPHKLNGKNAEILIHKAFTNLCKQCTGIQRGLGCVGTCPMNRYRHIILRVKQ